MKIISEKYREALDIEKWLNFRIPEYQYCSLIFL